MGLSPFTDSTRIAIATGVQCYPHCIVAYQATFPDVISDKACYICCESTPNALSTCFELMQPRQSGCGLVLIYRMEAFFACCQGLSRRPTINSETYLQDDAVIARPGSHCIRDALLRQALDVLRNFAGPGPLQQEELPTH